MRELNIKNTQTYNINKVESGLEMAKRETAMQIAKKLFKENDALYRGLSNGKGKNKKAHSK